jgi:hypothetical protein
MLLPDGHSRRKTTTSRATTKSRKSLKVKNNFSFAQIVRFASSAKKLPSPKQTIAVG